MRSRRDLKSFIDLPYQLFAGDPVWVPPLRLDIEMTLSRTKNPFFEHAEAEYFLAERDGEVVGRIAAIENRLHNETHDDRVGFYGWFDCIDDQDVANALFAAAGGVAARAQARRDARAGLVLHQRPVRPAGRWLRARAPPC